MIESLFMFDKHGEAKEHYHYRKNIMKMLFFTQSWLWNLWSIFPLAQKFLIMEFLLQIAVLSLKSWQFLLVLLKKVFLLDQMTVYLLDAQSQSKDPV